MADASAALHSSVLRSAKQGGLIIAAALSILLLLTFAFGGQRHLGRIDPALALPFLAPVMLALVAVWRAHPWRAMVSHLALFLLALLSIQALMVWMAEGQGGDILPHLLVMGGGGVLLSGLCVLMQALFRRSRLWCAGLILLSLPTSLLLGHAALAQLYAPRTIASSAPTAVMLTSLPLRWSGSGDFGAILSGEVGDDPALGMLEALGPIEVVDSLEGAGLTVERPLFLLHPRALAPQDLVAVDSHVRAGGRAIIFADALSSWHPPYPLGDVRNPPITSLLTPLLDHWGLDLAAVQHGQGGVIWVLDQGYGLRLHSAGRFTAHGDQCQTSAKGFIATCRIGRGEAWLIGDADMMQGDQWAAAALDAPHLLPSDIFYWIYNNLWGDDASHSWLRPIWMARAVAI